MILRVKGKAIQEALATQVKAVLTDVIDERRAVLNDKVIVNAGVALAFLTAHSADPSALTTLFYCRDQVRDCRVNLALKMGVLLSGNEKMNDFEKAKQDALNYVGLVLNAESGVQEIDGKDISANRPDEEIFRFDGALDALAHILDLYLRRFFKADSAISKLLFLSLTRSEILQKLNKEEDFSAMTRVYEQIPAFIRALPVPSLYSKDPKLSAE